MSLHTYNSSVLSFGFQIYTMSAVTNQPLPFGRLEREKHIRMIFRAFQNTGEPSCECQTHSQRPKPHRTPPDWKCAEQLSGPASLMAAEKVHMQSPGEAKTRAEEKWLERADGSDCYSVLDSVSQIHITTKPELQGQ